MADICVCAEPLEERGLFPCGHALCLNCTLKKRVLMKDMHCPYCRSNAPFVAVVSNGECSFEDATHDLNRGRIKYDSEEVNAQLQHILRYPCPECDTEQKDYKTLRAHVQEAHSKVLCDVCTKNQFNFSDEYILYPSTRIKEHLRNTHIFCKYCRTYFYGSSEFSSHCKQKHMGCGICERRDPEHPLYFENYNQLRNHYQDKHYRCMEPECLANKHIVFGTAMELQKHMVDAHMGHSTSKQSINMAQITRDTEELNVAGAEEDDKRSIDKANEAKFIARLEIVAGHDKDKIARISGANTTFLKALVPVDVFIATYESVLKEATFSQITLLLKAYIRLKEQQLPVETRRSLTFKIHQREQTEQADEESRRNAEKSEQQKQKKQSNQAKSQGLAPTEIQRINWGLNLPRTGGIDKFRDLPTLGNGFVKPQSSGSHRASSSTWKPPATGLASSSSGGASPSSSSLSLGNLPRLNKKTPAFPTESSQSLNRQSQSLNRPSAAASVATSHENQRTLSSLNTRGADIKQQAKRSDVQLNNLPSLPKNKKEEKKRTYNVLRVL